MNFECKVEADAENLFKQAKFYTANILLNAEEEIDGIFGNKYAEKHPELVIAYLQAVQKDFHTAVLLETVQKIAEVLEEKLNDSK